MEVHPSWNKMEFRIPNQRLCFCGKSYSPANLLALRCKAISILGESAQDFISFVERWFASDPYIEVQTSGSTGQPKRMFVEKERMMYSAALTCRALQLSSDSTALLCMNLRYIGAMMMVVRALVAGLNLVVIPPTGHPLRDIPSPVHFAAMVPLQVYNSLQSPIERLRLMQIEKLIIGGGAVDQALERRLQEHPGSVFSTYGMTETLSHIALRRLNGLQKSDLYTPIDPEIKLSLSSRGTLLIDAPALSLTPIETNDLVEFSSEQRFRVLGRTDNVVNSGGVKIQLEELEAVLNHLIGEDLALTYLPDQRLGQALVLLIQVTPDDEKWEGVVKSCLPAYHHPKYIFMVEQIPRTETGKIDRRACLSLAQSKLSENKGETKRER